MKHLLIPAGALSVSTIGVLGFIGTVLKLDRVTDWGGAASISLPASMASFLTGLILFAIWETIENKK